MSQVQDLSNFKKEKNPIISTNMIAYPKQTPLAKENNSAKKIAIFSMKPSL